MMPSRQFAPTSATSRGNSRQLPIIEC